jgi:F0F1-type ATP synthase membrane subunit b/b'
LLKTQLKSETAANKKSARDMEHALSESTALSQKSEREYITLRDSLKSMAESWKVDAERLREEMTKREEKLKAEAESMGRKYKKLVGELKSSADGAVKDSVIDLRAEDENIRVKIEEAFREEIQALRKEMDKVAGDGEEANQTAK